MSENATGPDATEPDHEEGQDQEPVGVQIGATDGEGSTFEPEEDPEAQAGS